MAGSENVFTYINLWRTYIESFEEADVSDDPSTPGGSQYPASERRCRNSLKNSGHAGKENNIAT